MAQWGLFVNGTTIVGCVSQDGNFSDAAASALRHAAEVLGYQVSEDCSPSILNWLIHLCDGIGLTILNEPPAPPSMSGTQVDVFRHALGCDAHAGANVLPTVLGVLSAMVLVGILSMALYKSGQCRRIKDKIKGNQQLSHTVNPSYGTV